MPNTGPRIDWAAARAYYIGLPHPRTFGAVAKRFGVSDTAVRRHAKREGWVDLAHREDEREAERALAKTRRSRQQRTDQILRIADRTFDLVELGLGEPGRDPELALELIFARFPEIHRIYRLEIGEATDHVALAEVQDGFRKSMRAAVATVTVIAEEMLTAKQAPDFVERFRRLYFDAVNEALAAGELEAGPVA